MGGASGPYEHAEFKGTAVDQEEVDRLRKLTQGRPSTRPAFPARVVMPEQTPRDRLNNWNEVALGYNLRDARAEAKRCTFCREEVCIKGCPVEIDIPRFIKAIIDNRMAEAARIIRRKSTLPAICGRICPQETQCEAVCRPAEGAAPVAILNLERFVADWELEYAPEDRFQVKRSELTGKRVAIVGSGPSGLTAAADLARMGHAVTLFEGLHKPGGVLMFGVPEYRLPKSIVQREIDYIQWLGVEIQCNTVVGRTLTVDDLLRNGRFHAVFVGTGAGLPIFQGIPGENIPGIYSANEYLTRINLMKAYRFPEYDTPIKVGTKVAVVGGGNTAMDAARTALRLGAKEVHVLYRRSVAEMTARIDEVKRAREEGVIFRPLTLPRRYVDNGRGWVTSVECIETELGGLDDEGRPTPVEKVGSEFSIEVDTVVIAIGVRPNKLLMSTTEGLLTTTEGTVVADPITGQTSKQGVWAGGDVVDGADTVISAMGAGKRAARSIDAYLREQG